MKSDPISEKGMGFLFQIEQKYRSSSRGMGLLILNTPLNIWRSLGGMRGRQGRIREGCGNSIF
jgi:hypothetical protein